MIDRPVNLEDRIGGKVQIEHYQGASFDLDGWKLDKVLDNILMVQYADINDEGTAVLRGSIWVPLGAVQQTWRVGKVILSGPECKVVKQGDYIIFPNDRGLQVANLNDLKNIVFLNEDRIFGVCSPKCDPK
jgi:hypothetical protein